MTALGLSCPPHSLCGPLMASDPPHPAWPGSRCRKRDTLYSFSGPVAPCSPGVAVARTLLPSTVPALRWRRSGAQWALCGEARSLPLCTHTGTHAPRRGRRAGQLRPGLTRKELVLARPPVPWLWVWPHAKAWETELCPGSPLCLLQRRKEREMSWSSWHLSSRLCLPHPMVLWSRSPVQISPTPPCSGLPCSRERITRSALQQDPRCQLQLHTWPPMASADPQPVLQGCLGFPNLP